MVNWEVTVFPVSWLGVELCSIECFVVGFLGERITTVVDIKTSVVGFMSSVTVLNWDNEELIRVGAVWIFGADVWEGVVEGVLERLVCIGSIVGIVVFSADGFTIIDCVTARPETSESWFGLDAPWLVSPPVITFVKLWFWPGVTVLAVSASKHIKIRLTNVMIIVFFWLLSGCCVFVARTEEVIFNRDAQHTVWSNAPNEEIVRMSLSKNGIVLWNETWCCNSSLKMSLNRQMFQGYILCIFIALQSTAAYVLHLSTSVKSRK